MPKRWHIFAQVPFLWNTSIDAEVKYYCVTWTLSYMQIEAVYTFTIYQIHSRMLNKSLPTHFFKWPRTNVIAPPMMQDTPKIINAPEASKTLRLATSSPLRGERQVAQKRRCTRTKKLARMAADPKNKFKCTLNNEDFKDLLTSMFGIRDDNTHKHEVIEALSFDSIL